MRDPFDAMIWAFMCTAWQGGRRSGELVRAKSRSGPWNAKFDMHRGRLSWDWSADGSTCHRVRIALGPDKTDPTGEEGHTVFLPHDGNAVINAASAIATTLAMDPTPLEKNAEAVLFRERSAHGSGRNAGFWAARLVNWVAGARRSADRPTILIAAHHRSCSCVFSVPWAAIEMVGLSARASRCEVVQNAYIVLRFYEKEIR